MFTNIPRRKSSRSPRPPNGTEAPLYRRPDAAGASKAQKVKEKFGLFTLHPSEDGYREQEHIHADVIALHGLGGDAFSTWTDKKGHMWLRDTLPSLVPGARIFTYGYNSATWSGDKAGIYEFALDLLERIRIARRTFEEQDRGIVFICHSLGGLVVKKALITAHEQPQYVLILEKIRGIVFMGTPHRGSKLAGLASPLGNIINLAILRKRIRTDLLSNLQISSNTIAEINMSVVHRLAPLRIVSFYEQQTLEPLGCRVVEPFSAILGLPNEKVLPIAADHRSMVRFSASDAEKYLPVWTAILELVEDCHFGPTAHIQSIETKTLLKKLYYCDYSQYLLDAPQPHKGTCTWIFDDPTFAKWINSSTSSLLWLRGLPGSGKTVLSRFLVETLKASPESCAHLRNAENLKVLYYLFLGQDQRRNSVGAVLKSLLHQALLVEPSAKDVIRVYYGDEEKVLWKDEQKDLWRALGAVLGLRRMKDTIIILDALDEVDFVSLEKFLESLTDMIKNLRDQASRQRTRVLLVSRPIPDIENALPDHLVKRMDISLDKSKDDINAFITSEVSKFGKRNKFPLDLTTQIIEEIVRRADGFFLWASLAWANFRESVVIWNQGVIEKQIRSLERLPPGLEPLYLSLLSKLTKQQLLELEALFECMVAAPSPLSAEEITVAVAIHDHCHDLCDLDLAFSLLATIERICPNFVKVNSDGTVNFVHQSFKEFITSGFFKNLTHHSSHQRLARICTTYLGFDAFTPITAQDVRRFYEGRSDDASKSGIFGYAGSELFGYAIRNLYSHMSHVPHTNILWLTFAELGVRRKDWFQLSPMQLVISMDAMSLASRLLENGYNVNEEVFEYRTFGHIFNAQSLLHHCISRKRSDWAQFLVKKGAFPNSKDTLGRTPIHLAIQMLQFDTVDILTGLKSIDLNIPDVEGRTPLHFAVIAGHDVLSKLLIDSRVDTAMTDNGKRTALTYAAYWGDETTVQLILNNSVSLQNHKDGDLSPLICAAQQHWKEFTLSLIPKVQDINTHRGLDRKGILHWAVINEWDGVLQASIEAGAKLNQIDISGKTPLHYAASLGNYSATKTLIRKGASVRINDNYGRTAVQAAAVEGFADVLTLLLMESDYDANEQDQSGCSLLHWAASWDWVRIVQMVVEHPDVDLGRKNDKGRTALHVAALCGCPGVLRVLLELGFYDINHQDMIGNTLLHLAARIGQVNVVEELLKLAGFERDRLNYFGQNALDVAAIYRQQQVVDRLKEAGLYFWAIDDPSLQPPKAEIKRPPTPNETRYGWDIVPRGYQFPTPVSTYVRSPEDDQRDRDSWSNRYGY